MKNNFSMKVGSERICSLKDIIENLADYLPDAHSVFKGTRPYLHLCDAVYAVLKAAPDDRPMFQQSLKHARTVFEDYCSFEIEERNRRVEDQRIEREALQAKIDEMQKGKPIKNFGWGSV